MSAVFNNIFSRRRRGPLYDDDEFEQPLSPRPVLPLPAPAPIRPTTPAPPIAESVTLPPPVDNARIAPPSWTGDDPRGRPRILTGVPTSERGSAERELFDRLQSYEPRKRSILRQIGMGALRGLAAGGPGGAVGGAVFATGTALLDPLAEDRAWKEKEMARSLGRQQIYRQQDREGLEDEVLQARVDTLRNPRPKLVEVVQPDGTTVLAPEQAGAITGRPKPAEPSYAVDIPGYGKVEGLKPASVTDYFGQIGRQRTEAEIRGEERMSNFERARISLSEAEAAERENLGQRQAMSQQLSALRAQRAALRPDPAKVIAGKIDDDNYWAQADALDAQIKDTETEVTRRQRLADEAGNEARRLRGEVGRYGARPTTTQGRYSGQRFSRAKVHARAKQLGMTVEAAEREITDNGGVIY